MSYSIHFVFPVLFKCYPFSWERNHIPGSLHQNDSDRSDSYSNSAASRTCPVPYIATAIRNLGTFNIFLGLAVEADLTVTDLTGVMRPMDSHPYMQSYDPSSIRLSSVSCQWFDSFLLCLFSHRAAIVQLPCDGHRSGLIRIKTGNRLGQTRDRSTISDPVPELIEYRLWTCLI